jgi:mycothiol synthase
MTEGALITWEWRDRCGEDPEIAAMLAAAAAYDAEQGFSPAPPAEDSEPGETQTTCELGAWISPDVGSVIRRPPRRLPVAFVRVTVDGQGTGVLELTVAPEQRSLGIGTLLFETLDLDTSADGGWRGTGARRLLAWARGGHPAAERMAMRFGAVTERTMWRVIRPLGTDGPSVSLRSVADGRPVDRATLSVALAALETDGAGEAVLLIDSDDSALLAECLAVGFHHDQTDICYRIPDRGPGLFKKLQA